jgi:ATP-dependent DNA ligase
MDRNGYMKSSSMATALSHVGRPKFHLLQQFRSQAPRIRYFIFDLLVFKGHDLMSLPLTERRKLLAQVKLKSPRIGISEQFRVSARAMLAGVRKQQLEGVVAKRKDSLYESGKRTGSWIKYRVNRSQEFVIGGYIPGRIVGACWLGRAYASEERSSAEIRISGCQSRECLVFESQGRRGAI